MKTEVIKKFVAKKCVVSVNTNGEEVEFQGVLHLDGNDMLTIESNSSAVSVHTNEVLMVKAA